MLFDQCGARSGSPQLLVLSYLNFYSCASVVAYAIGIATIVALRHAAASVVIIVNPIHTLTHALCASLQSAAVQGIIHELGCIYQDVSVWPANKKSLSARQFFSVIHV